MKFIYKRKASKKVVFIVFTLLLASIYAISCYAGDKDKKDADVTFSTDSKIKVDDIVFIKLKDFNYNSTLPVTTIKKVKGDTQIYLNALEDTNLVYEVTEKGFKEKIMLYKKPKYDKIEFTINLGTYQHMRVGTNLYVLNNSMIIGNFRQPFVKVGKDMTFLDYTFDGTNYIISMDNEIIQKWDFKQPLIIDPTYDVWDGSINTSKWICNGWNGGTCGETATYIYGASGANGYADLYTLENFTRPSYIKANVLLGGVWCAYFSGIAYAKIGSAVFDSSGTVSYNQYSIDLKNKSNVIINVTGSTTSNAVYDMSGLTRWYFDILTNHGEDSGTNCGASSYIYSLNYTFYPNLSNVMLQNNSDSITGYCNATDYQGLNLTLYHYLYRNNILNQSGSVYTNSTSINYAVVNITYSDRNTQAWRLGCIASNNDSTTRALNTSIRYSDVYLFNPTVILNQTNRNITGYFYTPMTYINNGTMNNINLTVNCSWYHNVALVENFIVSDYVVNSTRYMDYFYSSSLLSTDDINLTCSVAYPYTESKTASAKVNPLFNIVPVCLIDEKNNTLFDVNNLTVAKAYDDFNATLYNFKTLGACINFSTAYPKIRIELCYSNGECVTRYFDVNYIYTEPFARICANREFTTHYTQLITSASSRPAILKSLYANCYAAADDTQFAYQGSYVLKAYTIDTIYYLYITEEGHTVYLASLDGGLQSYYDIDTISFRNSQEPVYIIGEGLSIQRHETSANTLIISYQNINEDNLWSNLVISLYNGTILFNVNNTLTPDDFTVNFDYTGITIYDNTTFHISLTYENYISVNTIEGDFYPSGSSPAMDSRIAVAFSVLLLVFGLTFASAKTTLSWFGMVVVIGAIIILAISEVTWYTKMLMGMEFVALIYITIIMFSTNKPDAIGG